MPSFLCLFLSFQHKMESVPGCLGGFSVIFRNSPWGYVSRARLSLESFFFPMLQPPSPALLNVVAAPLLQRVPLATPAVQLESCRSEWIFLQICSLCLSFLAGLHSSWLTQPSSAIRNQRAEMFFSHTFVLAFASSSLEDDYSQRALLLKYQFFNLM